ncbi:MAG: HAD family hydrolase [Candidatus Methylomirabilales bacterium]
MVRPDLLALDFDGVLCDSVHEAFRSSWEVCRELGVAKAETPPAGLAAAFVRIRPVLEFGWEFPLPVCALLDGVPEEELRQNFRATWRRRTLERHGLTREELMRRFDAVRDRAIAADLDAWLADQALYPGVADRLRAALKEGTRVFVITTKEGRFAHRLLTVHGVDFPADQVWGKEQARPKPELLRTLIGRYRLPPAGVWFVEDRLNTLRAVERERDLDGVGLFFATWGYTLPAEVAEARADRRIAPLTLQQFCGDFEGWRRAGA